jgi:signal transduction histidine kinase
VADRDGRGFWQLWLIQPLLDETGNVVELQATIRDAMADGRATRDRRSRDVGQQAIYERRVHELAGRLIAAQEAERKRIARDLHDDLSQQIGLLSVDAALLTGEQDSARRVPLVDAVNTRIKEIASAIHDLSHQLHPSGIEILGFVAAIDAFCRDIRVRHRLSVEFVHRNVPRNVPADVALCIFRVVQEALHNVVKHSRAQYAVVELIATHDQIDLHVADSGAGFDPAAATARGIGLIGMRERALFVGGQFVVHSHPGRGTRLGVRIPLRHGVNRLAAQGAA